MDFQSRDNKRVKGHQKPIKATLGVSEREYLAICKSLLEDRMEGLITRDDFERALRELDRRDIPSQDAQEDLLKSKDKAPEVSQGDLLGHMIIESIAEEVTEGDSDPLNPDNER